LFLIYISWDYVLIAWANGEKSHEAGGLPFVYLLKTLIVVLPILLLVQATTNVLASLFNIPLSIPKESNPQDSNPEQGGNS
jgi:TRAP-type mannitol/chloroaromatic compound transport system permease small subunit